MNLRLRSLDCQQNKGDQGHAGDAVGFETIGAGSNRVTRVVARAVCDDARVAGIVFLDLENDLHQVGADVGNLGKDAAGNTQSSCAKRFANRETDEAGAGVGGRNKQQDEEHDQQFNRDQHHADAHAGLERNRKQRIRLSAQAGECHARVRKRVDADAEPRHAVAAGDADQAEQQDDWQGYSDIAHRCQNAEVERDNDRDENPEQHNELALRDQIGLAGLIDQFGHFPHSAMNGQVLQLHIDHQAEEQAGDAEEQSDRQKLMSVQAEEIRKTHGRQVGQLQAGFASARVLLRAGECGKQQPHEGRHRLRLTLQESRSARLDSKRHQERQSAQAK